MVGAGLDVTVLEARDRVGGRVWSQRLGPDDPTSPVIERGAEFVLDGYDTMRAYADVLGLSVVDTGMSYYVREPRDAAGRPSGADVDALAAAGVPLSEAATAPDAYTRPVADLVSALGVPPAVAQAVLARVEISCAHHAERLAGTVLDHVASLAPLPSHRIGGGNQSIARRLGERLGGRIRLRCPVRAVTLDGNGVRVVTDDGPLYADRVVLTVPLPLLRDLPIDGLPGARRTAWREVLIGEAAKLHVGLAGTVPASAVMSVPGRFWSWTATDASGTVAPVLNAFAGSPRALASLDVASGPERWRAALLASRPDLAGRADMGSTVLTTWSDDPWARGAYVATALGSAPGDDAALWRPAGPVHLAGEHTAGEWSGLMEGALRSGRRAALEVLAARDTD